jgi:hypothetical protein
VTGRLLRGVDVEGRGCGVAEKGGRKRERQRNKGSKQLKEDEEGLRSSGSE